MYLTVYQYLYYDIKFLHGTMEVFNILRFFLLSSLFNCRTSSCSKESSYGKRKRSPFLEKERTTFLPSRGYMFHAYTMCAFSTTALKGYPSLIINSWGRQLLRNIDKNLAAVTNDTTKRCSLGSLNMLIYNIHQISSDTLRVSVSFNIPHRYSYTWLKV